MACELGPSTAQCDFILQGRGPEAVAQTGRWPMDPINGTDYEFNLQMLTITAGLEKLYGGGDGDTPVTTTVGTESSGAQATAGTGSSPGLNGPQETGSVAASGALSAATGAPTSGAGSLVPRAIGGVGMGLAVLCGAIDLDNALSSAFDSRLINVERVMVTVQRRARVVADGVVRVFVLGSSIFNGVRLTRLYMIFSFL